MLYGHHGTETNCITDVPAILIPDGTFATLKKDETIFIQQVLGGMFTVQAEDGMLYRVDGKDAGAIGQLVPDERKLLSKDEVLQMGIHEAVKSQLASCYDPEIPVNILDLGLVYSRDIKEDDKVSGNFIVNIAMTLTAPGCGMGEVLKSDVEKKLNDLPLVSASLVDLVFDPPWDSSMMSEAAKLKLGFL